MQIQKSKNEKAKKAAGNITGKTSNSPLWEVMLTPDSKITIRIPLEKKYLRKDINVYKYVPEQDKFLPVKNAKWTIVRVGTEYSIRIENISGGIYTFTKK